MTQLERDLENRLRELAHAELEIHRIRRDLQRKLALCHSTHSTRQEITV